MHQELVRNWMTRSVITIDPETTLPEAHRLMTEHRVRRLPVVEQGRLVGIVTRGDIRGAEASDASSLNVWDLTYLLAKLRIREIMTRNPVTIADSATIGDAAKVMLDNRVSGLPVVDADGTLTGIITESDIFGLIVTAWDDSEAAPNTPPEKAK